MSDSAHTLGHALSVMTDAANHYDSVYHYDYAARMRNARTMVSLHDETLALIRQNYARALGENAALNARIAEVEAQRDDALAWINEVESERDSLQRQLQEERQL